MIELKHYSPKEVNDSFSVSVFKSIIERADSRQLFFTLADYRRLAVFQTVIDDELKGKGWAFFDLFQSLYKASLVRADSIVNILLQKPLDLNQKETVTYGPENAEFDFAADLPALIKRWTKYLKYKILEQAFEFVEDSAQTSSLRSVLADKEPIIRQKIRKVQIKNISRLLNHPAGYPDFIAEFYLDAIASGFDPHTNFFSPESKQQFKEDVSSEAYFFGIEFEENDKGQIVVEAITPGGPAWKSGEINKGDQLISLHWEGKEVQYMETAELDEVLAVLDRSTTDKLLFRFRKPDATMINVLLKKEKLENEENIVKGFILKAEKKAGYILLPGFYTEWESETGSSCANDVAKEILKLKKENIDGLILDVRYNGGGSLGETLEMAGIFLDEGPLIAEKTKDGKVINLKDPNRGIIYDGPLVIIVNGQSASASEELAAILQDYNRAVIVGSNTYGKATMQQVFPMDTLSNKLASMETNKDAVKITVAKLFRMDGQTAQLKGVMPDIIFPDAFDGLELGERYSKSALPADSVRKNNYYKPWPGLPVRELAKRSAARVVVNPDFVMVKNFSEEQKKNKLTLTIPLNVDGYEAWARKFSFPDINFENKYASEFTVENHTADKKLMENDTRTKEVNDAWLKNLAGDFYLEEAFRVLTDLINLLKPPIKN